MAKYRLLFSGRKEFIWNANQQGGVFSETQTLQISLIWPSFFIISLLHGLRPDEERSTDNLGRPGKQTIILFSAEDQNML